MANYAVRCGAAQIASTEQSETLLTRQNREHSKSNRQPIGPTTVQSQFEFLGADHERRRASWYGCDRADTRLQLGIELDAVLRKDFLDLSDISLIALNRLIGRFVHLAGDHLTHGNTARLERRDLAKVTLPLFLQFSEVFVGPCHICLHALR